MNTHKIVPFFVILYQYCSTFPCVDMGYMLVYINSQNLEKIELESLLKYNF